MKISVFILAIYVLGLSFVTCNDGISHDDLTAETISNIFDIEHPSEEGAADYCSPFCSCQCCQMTMTVAIAESFELIQPTISTELFSNLYGIEQKFNYSKFEPPKV